MSQPTLLRDASLLALKGKCKCFLSWEQSRAITILGTDSDGCDATAHGQGTQPRNRSLMCFPYPQGFRLAAPLWSRARPQGRVRRKEFFLCLKLFHLAKENDQLTELGKRALDLCPPLGWESSVSACTSSICLVWIHSYSYSLHCQCHFWSGTVTLQYWCGNDILSLVIKI